MEFTRTLRNKQVTKHQDDLLKEAENKICIDDFDSNLYIAYEGTPLIPIEEDWLPQDIIAELSKLRQNYVKGKMKNYKPTLIESLFKMESTC